MPLHGYGTLCPDCWVTVRVQRIEANMRAAVAATVAAENGGDGR